MLVPRQLVVPRAVATASATGRYCGLVRWDTARGAHSNYTTTDGLASNIVKAITKDNKDKL